MTEAAATPGSVPEAQLQDVALWRAGSVNLRRDLHKFLCFVEDKGLVRSRRENAIPKTAARKLANLLSHAGESQAVEEEGCGVWSDHVSRLARQMGLVTFDIKGEYVGYTSTAPSFVDNYIEVQHGAWESYLKLSPLQKEKAILEAHLQMTESEFFHEATLVGGERFDTRGSATGPASRMKLPLIRRGLLKLLAGLEPEIWYDMRSLVDWLRDRAPHLILNPDTRKADSASLSRLRDWEYNRKYGDKSKRKRAPKPEMVLEDMYTNFREFPAGEGRYGPGGPDQITSRLTDAFHRVEGRYLEYFLAEVPYLCGFVDLAYRHPNDPHGLQLSPPFERLRAVRLQARLRQVMEGDSAINTVKVTVLPTFEVMVEAPSYPEVVLDALEPFTRLQKEDGPIHSLILDKKKVAAQVAGRPDARPVSELLEELSQSPLPRNVIADLAYWSRHGEKVTVYEGFGLLELPAGNEARRDILAGLDSVVSTEGLEGFALVRNPRQAFSTLEGRHLVPQRITHTRRGFASCPGRLGKAPRPRVKARPARKKKVQAHLQMQDLVGCRSSCSALLVALQEALGSQGCTCLLADKDLLVLPAASLPELRAALRSLRNRFDVTLETLTVDVD